MSYAWGCRVDVDDVLVPIVGTLAQSLRHFDSFFPNQFTCLFQHIYLRRLLCLELFASFLLLSVGQLDRRLDAVTVGNTSVTHAEASVVVVVALERVTVGWHCEVAIECCRCQLVGECRVGQKMVNNLALLMSRYASSLTGSVNKITCIHLEKMRETNSEHL